MKNEYLASDLAKEEVQIGNGKSGTLRIVDQEYNPPFVIPTGEIIFKGLFFFDKIEFALLVLSWWLTKLIFEPLIGENMISEPLLTFWGIITVGFFTFRHSSSSIFHFISQRAMIQKKMENGEYIPEFKVIGFLIGMILAFFARGISLVLIWVSHVIN